ncbi:MAG: FAD-binding oxidoreductase [Chloroflexi bacterium]|nr:FAD-binding oxidoreductase [Chloroflexota bacterium]
MSQSAGDSLPQAKPDVVIIGAGAIGCSIAYALAREQVRVTVLDSRGRGRGIFGASWVGFTTPRPHRSIPRASHRLSRRPPFGAGCTLP